MLNENPITYEELSGEHK
jgi:hypothetical protein